MSETNQYLHERYSVETMRMPPVLMGVASAAIGFAFHETASRTLSHSLWPILAAVLLWSISFAAGIKCSQNFAQSLKSNTLLLKAQALGDEAGVAVGEEAHRLSAKKVTFYGDAQQWALLFGALSYLGGHIWHLAAA